jgi:hypothetical protein
LSCDAATDLEACTEPAENYYLLIHDDVGIFVGSCFSGCTECLGPFLYDCTNYPGFAIETQANLVLATLVTDASYDITGCRVYTLDTSGDPDVIVCLEAEDGYYVDADAAAAACEANCALCDAEGFDGCSSPAPGYFLDTDKITACSSHCLECDDATTCTLCDEENGWGLKSAACVN